MDELHQVRTAELWSSRGDWRIYAFGDTSNVPEGGWPPNRVEIEYGVHSTQWTAYGNVTDAELETLPGVDL